jgi:hypothetical protein
VTASFFGREVKKAGQKGGCERKEKRMENQNGKERVMYAKRMN